MAQDFHFKLKKFLGLRAIAGSKAALLPGESPDMLNFKVLEDYGLEKREGFREVFATEGTLRGIWAGKCLEEDLYCAVIGDSLFFSQTGFDSLTKAEGEVPGEEKVEWVPFHDGLYLLTGAGIRRYRDGAVETVEPYIPTVMISTTPAGSGVTFEEPNILTDRVRQTFSPTGMDTIFFPLFFDRVKEIDWVKHEGKLLDESQYSWDSTGCAVVILNAPRKGIDTIEVQMKLRQSDESRRILNCRYAVGFGGANDTRVFLYGNKEYPAMRYHSGVVDGKPSFAYFPETAYTMVGTGAPITSILRHYDRQLIFTESAAYYSYLEYMTGENGKLIAAFPTLPLSDDRGCLPFGQATLVENNPCTLTETGLIFWMSTNIRDERNARIMSDSIARALQGEDAEKAILFNRKSTSELYLSFDGRVYVYNYRLGLFYYYELSCPRGFCEMGIKTYFYTDNGIYLMGGETDNGEPIPARWESGLMDFSDADARKNLFGLTLHSETREQTDAQVILEGENEEGTVRRGLFFHRGQDFSTGKLRLPLRRLNYLKIRLEILGEGPFRLKGIYMKGRKIEK